MEEIYEECMSILIGQEGMNIPEKTNTNSLQKFKYNLEEADLVEPVFIQQEVQPVFWHHRNHRSLLQEKIIQLLINIDATAYFGYHYLVQFWEAATVDGRHYRLSNSNQPFCVSTNLTMGACWYRKQSIGAYDVDVDGAEGEQLGTVARAFKYKKSESTHDVNLYTATEFPLRHTASHCGFKSYMVLPLFDFPEKECCGVLEILSAFYIMELDTLSPINQGLQLAMLRSTHIYCSLISRLASQMPDKYKKQPDGEIRHILELAIKEVPLLHLAQVWVPCEQCVDTNSINLCCMERASFINSRGKVVNQYDHDKTDEHMFHYLQACEFHNPKMDLSRFRGDLYDVNISNNPLAHYAGRARLSLGFAICLQSSSGSNHFCVIEFFLQPKDRETESTQSSMDLLMSMIKANLKSYRCVWNSETNRYNGIRMSTQFSLRPLPKVIKTPYVFDASSVSMTPIKEKMQQLVRDIAMAADISGTYSMVQFWEPKMIGRRCLDTSDQPFALGCWDREPELVSFREECTRHTYMVDEEAKEDELGPPGRVFTNGYPEIIRDLFLYSKDEFPMRSHAVHSGFEKYFVLPVFNEHECVGVLEFIGLDYSDKIKFIRAAFKKAKLYWTRIDKLRLMESKVYFNFEPNERSVIGSHVLNLFSRIPHCHMANVWALLDGLLEGSNSRCMEWIECSDIELNTQLSKLNAVDRRIIIEPRQGILGMVVDSEFKSYFCRNTSGLSIADQPLAYYQRKLRCKACFVICLKSSDPDQDLFALEFFLNQSGLTNEYLLSFLSFLLPIIKNELKSFELPSGKKLGDEELVVEVIEFSAANQLTSSQSYPLDVFPIKFQNIVYSQKEHQLIEGRVQKTKKGKKTSAMDLSLEDLKPHFGKKLDDVAKEFGFGRTTMQRQCRRLGIRKWPSNNKEKNNPCLWSSLQCWKASKDKTKDNNEENDDVVEITEGFNYLQSSPRRKVAKERMVSSSVDLLPAGPLKSLFAHAKNELCDGRGIQTDLDDEVFGETCQIYVHLEDIIPFCNLEPISGNCIVIYMLQLYNQIRKTKTLQRFLFVNPFTISYIPNSLPSERAYRLALRLTVAAPKQLVLVPCNVGQHWILTVIEPFKNVVYLLDPISHDIRDRPWKLAVNRAMLTFNIDLKKGDVGEPTWEVIKVPRQPDSKQCGYYVMCFMKEIVRGLHAIDSSSLSSLFATKEYSQADIDEVCTEWAVEVIKSI